MHKQITKTSKTRSSINIIGYLSKLLTAIENIVMVPI